MGVAQDKVSRGVTGEPGGALRAAARHFGAEMSCIDPNRVTSKFDGTARCFSESDSQTAWLKEG
jgi:hypothetical protein